MKRGARIALPGMLLALSCHAGSASRSVHPSAQVGRGTSGTRGAPSALGPLGELGDEDATEGEPLGRALLAEMISPGGTADRGKLARDRLEHVEHRGLYAALSRGLYDGLHGKLRSAGGAYLDAIRAARESRDPLAPAIAWFCTNHLLALRPRVSTLPKEAAAIVDQGIASPGNIGFRARSELVNWWTQQAYEDTLPGVPDASADRQGCLRDVHLAGPFGHNLISDRRQSFEPERPGRWPAQWPADLRRHAPPRVLRTERHGCQIQAHEQAPAGVYYAETFIDLPKEQDVLLAVQGAFAVLVDDFTVLTRDTRHFGVWTRFGAAVRLSAGRHRIVARIGGGETSIRVLGTDGSPLGLKGSDDSRAPYQLTAPRRLRDPNVVSAWVRAGGLEGHDDIARYVMSFLAHVEEQDDLAAVIFEPLVADHARATGPALALAAIFTEHDPIFPDSDRRDLLRDLREQAVKKDDELWWARFWLTMDRAEKAGAVAGVEPMRKLASRFPEVPEILGELARLYAQLDWKAERAGVLKELAARFPKDPAILEQALEVFEREGKFQQADELAKRISELNPDSEIGVERGVARRDFPAAIAELKRLAKRRPDRKDIADRIADMLARSGSGTQSLAMLERAVAKKPLDPALRLRAADARLQSGDRHALWRAIVDAIVAGADTSELSGALDLVEGMTELDPYRLDGRKVVAEYEASNQEMEGNAARILDYSAIWVHPDGSSRMLEHELIRIQSQEAIGKMTEQQVPEGLMLRMRVLKKDGTILEPEFVAGKPTLTMPHLEIGDYLETETITNKPGDGQFGKQYIGPQWFFREENIAYWRSELLVIAPTEKPLVIEALGHVPKPEVSTVGPLTFRRFRVERSPAAPDEPGSPPIQEFLPSVRPGWGIDVPGHLQRLVELVMDEQAHDPRLKRIASEIVADVPATLTAKPSRARATGDEERARKLYHWVLANIEEGKESDGRRIIIGKSGNRTSAFLYLCRQLQIPVEIAVVRDKLSPVPPGPMSAAESLREFAIRIGTPKPIWLTVRDKFAPFGYLPPELRGQTAYLLTPQLTQEVTPTDGMVDGISYEGGAELRPDGSAKVHLVQRFLGRVAMGLRAAIEQLPEARLKDAVEGKLLARALPGAKLLTLKVLASDALDEPLVLEMELEVPQLARRRGDQLVLSPPFGIRLTQLTSLPSRETPLLIREATYARQKLEVTLPPGARITADPARGELRDGERHVVVADRQAGGKYSFDRLVDLPSGRIAPSAYPKLQEFARRVDDLSLRDVVIQLAPGTPVSIVH